jgi:hypothetical protein
VSPVRSEIVTVGEPVTVLVGYPPQTRVRLAVAPGYPQASTIGVIACSPDDADLDGRGPDPDAERVVWIGEGTQIGYLPEIARNALRHNWT